MSVFAVVCLEEPDSDEFQSLQSSIASVADEVFAEYVPAVWFVSYKGTTGQLSKSLSLGDDHTSATIVLSIRGFSGFADHDLWEWLDQNK